MPIINSRGRHCRLLLHSQLAFGFEFEDLWYPVEAIITGYDQNNMVHIYYRNTISLRFLFARIYLAEFRYKLMFLDEETTFVFQQF